MLFAIFQAAGLSVVAGVRAWLPALLVAVLARADLGVDFEGTDFAFFESAVSILILFAFTVVIVFTERRYKNQTPTFLLYALPISTMSVGGLLGGACFAEQTSIWWPGILLGITLSGSSYAASSKFLLRVKKRLDDETRKSLPALVDGAMFIFAAAIVALPPVAVFPSAFFLWLLIALRKKDDHPGGLRILR